MVAAQAGIAVAIIGSGIAAPVAYAIGDPRCEAVAGRDMESIELAAIAVLAKEGKRGVLYRLCLRGPFATLSYHNAVSRNGYSTLYHLRCRVGRPSVCNSNGRSRLLRLGDRTIEVSEEIDENVARRVAAMLVLTPEGDQLRIPPCGEEVLDTFSGKELRTVEFIGLSDEKDRIEVRLGTVSIQMPLEAAERGEVQISCYFLIVV